MATIARICLVGRFNLPQTCGALYTSKRHASSDMIVNKNVTLTNYKRGRGGRSSFSGIVATVFGATGFVGRYVVNRLGKCGSQVIIPYRGDQYEVDRLKILGDLGQVLFQEYHLKDEESLRKCMQYSNVVVNLIGREYETKNFSFRDIYVDGPRNMARIAKECGVERFIHFSALNSANPQDHRVILKTGSSYLTAKADGEEAVLQEFPEATIIRPSDIIGEESKFHMMYLLKSRSTLNRRCVQIWEEGLKTEKMPVLIDDVIDCVMSTIYEPETMGRSIDLVGPEKLTLNEWVSYIFWCRGMSKFYIAPCNPKYHPIVWKAGVFQSSYWPWKPSFTKDMLEREIVTDRTVPGNMTLDDLGIAPQSVKSKLQYLIRPKTRINYHREVIGQEVPADIDQGNIPVLKALIAALVIWLGMKMYAHSFRYYMMPSLPRVYRTRNK